MKYTDIQSIVSLSEEEVASYSKRPKSAFYDGLIPKFNNMPPEFLRVCFDTYEKSIWNKEKRESELIPCQLFDSLWSWDDLETLYSIIGNPVATTHNIEKSSSHYFESFKNLQVDDLIKLSKAFTILFEDGSKIPYQDWNEGNPSWEIANLMDSRIFQRNPIHDVNEITNRLPQYILEPPDLYIRLFNESGSHKIPTERTPSDWGHEWNQKLLRTWRKYIGCPITKIPDENRYRIDITTPQQFLQLLKSYTFIHRYNPKTGIVSLIYTQVSDVNTKLGVFVGLKVEK